MGLQSSKAPSSGILKRQLCGREREKKRRAREGGRERERNQGEELEAQGRGEGRGERESWESGESRESRKIAFKL